MGIVRIIPRLDIKGQHLVKGIHLEGLRVLGNPEDFAKLYFEAGADEIMYMDVVASLYERNSLAEIITKTAKEIFIPLTVGGGIRTTEDISKVLRAGADKVSLNTAAIRNPEFLKEASMKFGSSTIVVAVEAIRQPGGEYLCYVDNGREYTGIDAVEWAQKAEQLGAGELVITSVDREGTGSGFDADLINQISRAVGIPIIAHGGAGTKEHVAEVCKECSCDAVALASLLHYKAIDEIRDRTLAGETGNMDFLKSGRQNKSIVAESLDELKKYLSTWDIKIRMK
jgi:cyclase